MRSKGNIEKMSDQELIDVLNKYGSITEASDMLNCSRQTIYIHLRKRNIYFEKTIEWRKLDV